MSKQYRPIIISGFHGQKFWVIVHFFETAFNRIHQLSKGKFATVAIELSKKQWRDTYEDPLSDEYIWDGFLKYEVIPIAPSPTDYENKSVAKQGVYSRSKEAFMLKRILEKKPEFIICGRNHERILAKELRVPRKTILHVGPTYRDWVKSRSDEATPQQIRKEYREFFEAKRALLKERLKANRVAQKRKKKQPFSRTGLLRRKKN